MSEDQQQNQQGEEKRQLTALEQLTRPAEEFVNDATVEVAWLSTAVRHMEAYYRLISSLKEPASLRLTPNDDLIYGAFREAFPELNVERLTEEAIKSAEAKAKWRQFCNEMEDKVADFNFATMMRLNARLGYSEENSIVVPRAQFVAIEIARNRLGFNDNLPPPPPSEEGDN
ncbi:Protein pbdc1 [Tyrophagus putrescentiae]|nr:Protein pbdc1 [Tyrophagus putrescentiae]